MNKIVLINGKKRSGKDFTANLIKEEIERRGYTCEIMSFASPMKFIVSKLFGITEDELDLYKNDKYPIYTQDSYGDLDYITDFREVLQRFGTEAMKPIFGDNVWASILYDKAHKSQSDVVLVPDFRFLIEHINSQSVLTLKIVHKDIEEACKDPHPSETELNDFLFNSYIDNTGYPDTTDVISYYVDSIGLISDF